MARFLGHLPLVRLASGATSLATHHGQIRALPYAEWYAYDGHFPDSERHYDQTAPSFFELAVPGGAEIDAEVAAFQASEDAATADLRLCHEAMILVSGARLPIPALSMAYLVMEGDEIAQEVRDVVTSTQVRRVGPAERELIVHGSQQQSVVLDEATIGEVDRVWRRLETRGGNVGPALAALCRTTRPGYSPLNETLHLVAGLEALLVARGEPLTATFARRYSVLATDRDVEAMLEHARYLYRLRSDVVHGRPARRLTPEWEDFLRRDHRFWTCLVVRRMLRWFEASDAGVGELRAALDRAWDSPEELAAFRATCGSLDG